MKKLIISIFLASSLLATVYPHPVHVSVVNISIEGLLFNVTINTFVDDWETAYFHYFGKIIKLTSDENLKGGWFRNYLENSFSIRIDDQKDPINFETDTIYFNDESMTIEMHASLSNTPDSLYIYNSILTDIFFDQTNLLIYSIADTEKGIKFDYIKREELVKL